MTETEQIKTNVRKLFELVDESRGDISELGGETDDLNHRLIRIEKRLDTLETTNQEDPTDDLS